MGFQKGEFPQKLYIADYKSTLFFQERKLEVCSLCVSVPVCACVMYARVFVGVYVHIPGTRGDVCKCLCIYVSTGLARSSHSGFIRSYSINLNEPLNNPMLTRVHTHVHAYLWNSVRRRCSTFLQVRKAPACRGGQKATREPKASGNER